MKGLEREGGGEARPTCDLQVAPRAAPPAGVIDQTRLLDHLHAAMVSNEQDHFLRTALLELKDRLILWVTGQWDDVPMGRAPKRGEESVFGTQVAVCSLGRGHAGIGMGTVHSTVQL